MQRCGREPSIQPFVFLRSHLIADNQTDTWPDLLIGLYYNLTGRRAEIAYEFANMHIKIPSGTVTTAEHAEWVLNGTMKIFGRETRDRTHTDSGRAACGKYGWSPGRDRSG